jgi:hypothetical protein
LLDNSEAAASQGAVYLLQFVFIKYEDCGDMLLNRKNRGGLTLPLEEFEKL